MSFSSTFALNWASNVCLCSAIGSLNVAKLFAFHQSLTMCTSAVFIFNVAVVTSVVVVTQ